MKVSIFSSTLPGSAGAYTFGSLGALGAWGFFSLGSLGSRGGRSRRSGLLWGSAGSLFASGSALGWGAGAGWGCSGLGSGFLGGLGLEREAADRATFGASGAGSGTW